MQLSVVEDILNPLYQYTDTRIVHYGNDCVLTWIAVEPFLLDPHTYVLFS